MVIAIRCDVISLMRKSYEVKNQLVFKEAVGHLSPSLRVKYLEYDLFAAQVTCERASEANVSFLVRLRRLLAHNMLARATNSMNSPL